MRYRVVVKGLGKVYDGDSGAEAKRKFQLFVKESKKRQPESASKSVTLFKNYEIVWEYQPPDSWN